MFFGKGARRFSFKRFALGIGVGVVVAVGSAYLLTNLRGSGLADGLTILQADFIDVLPADLTDEQIEEITDILVLYNNRADLGQVASSDQLAISGKMEEYISDGGIERSELSQFIALVSFFSYRLDPDHNPEDGSGVHPLLTPEEDDNDDGT